LRDIEQRIGAAGGADLAREDVDSCGVRQESDFNIRQWQRFATFRTVVESTALAITARTRTAAMVATVGTRSARAWSALALLAAKTCATGTWPLALAGRAVTAGTVITITATTTAFGPIFAAMAGIFIDGRRFLSPSGQKKLL
jgi:hypothetical protein